MIIHHQLYSGVEKMSSLREDTYNWGYREGVIQTYSEIILSKLKEENCSIDEAIQSLYIPSDTIEKVKTEVNRKLGF